MYLQEGHRDNEREREFLAAVASALAGIIERKRAEEALAERTRQLEAVRGVATEITRELDLTTLLYLITRRATELVGAPAGVVSLWDEAAQVLIPQAWHGHGDWVGQMRVRLGEGITGLVAKRREGLVVNDYRTSPSAYPGILERTGVTAALAEPLMYRDRLVGVITLSDEGAPRSFAEQDGKLLALFADQAAVAIANAQLFERVVQAKAEWEDTFDSISELVAVIGTDHRLLRVNRALAERLRVAPEALVGQHCYTALHGADCPLPQCPHAQTIAAGKPSTREVEDPHLGGTFLVTTSPFRTAEGRVGGCVHVARDITELKHLEAEARQRQRFEDLSRAKSAFIATMSHELRTPLNSVLGFAELLQGQAVGPLTEKQARYLGHIHSSGKHLLALISDILDLAKVEAGKIVLEAQPLPVAAALEDILVIARGLANQKGQTIEVQIAPDLPPLPADPVRFKQILFNLLSNAVKYTPDGGRITVRAGRAHGIADRGMRIAELPATDMVPQSAIRKPQSEMGDFLQIEVTDAGIGIRPEDLPRIFQEFVQLEAAGAKRQGGTGLGLALTKQIVELHGGHIWATSDGEGRGSTFTVMLPLGGPPDGGE